MKYACISVIYKRCQSISTNGSNCNIIGQLRVAININERVSVLCSNLKQYITSDLILQIKLLKQAMQKAKISYVTVS